MYGWKYRCSLITDDVNGVSNRAATNIENISIGTANTTDGKRKKARIQESQVVLSHRSAHNNYMGGVDEWDQNVEV